MCTVPLDGHLLNQFAVIGTYKEPSRPLRYVEKSPVCDRFVPACLHIRVSAVATADSA